jgi:hypothetical protein
LAAEIIVGDRSGDNPKQSKERILSPWLEFTEDTALLFAEL